MTEARASVADDGAAELIVVEDGTSELDESALRGARLLRLPPVGRSRARNAGVEAASSPYVAFLDADDVSLPGRLERQRAALAAAPSAALSFGRVIVVDGESQPLEGWNELLARRFERLEQHGATFDEVLAAQCPIYTSATMVRRNAFLEAGGYDPAFDAYEDLDLYLRLSRLGGLVPVAGEPVAAYRLHGANTPSEALYRASLDVAEKHLPQARGRGRRLLLERRVDAFWALGAFAEARREAARALAVEPLLLAHGRFAKRLAGLALPRALLEARR